MNELSLKVVVFSKVTDNNEINRFFKQPLEFLNII
jgi:hypothetical protein